MDDRGVIGVFYLVLAAVITLAVSILIMNYMYDRAASTGRTGSGGDTARGHVISLCTKLREAGAQEVTEVMELPSKVERDELVRQLVTYCFPGASPGEVSTEDGCAGEGPGHVLHWCGPDVLLGTKRLAVQASSAEDYDIIVRVKG
jgi:hypothetical protein